jgi:hypothetical protein
VRDDCITARSIQLVDTNGHVRINLDGRGLIQMLNPSGEPAIELQVSKDGEATVRIANPNGSVAISLGSSLISNGITVHCGDGSPSSSIGIDHSADGISGPKGGYVIIRDPDNQNPLVMRP